ncbi:hypothetical protein CQ018_06925 [Arthrobacter sp. MYb227]|uniref:DUF6286 domain-containing protein n=1 Tax=Arthrobacter sp. MYb227 TaxID=1848601 RepID=UPI000CFB13AA|nr:DUF6286 domain-containing protein [Arthrobacter sp. MYb227]PQZ95052.1 hypothetical protein CQ018_06925 [Arthrobacter sp. MYb227]
MNSEVTAGTRVNSPAPVARTRSTRGLAATITAILIGAVAITMIAAGFSRIRTGQWPEFVLFVASDRSLTGSSPLVIAVASLLAILGLILLLSALIPGPRKHFAVATENSRDVRINGSGIARLVEHRIDSIDGVSAVRANLRRVRVEVRVSTPLRATETVHNKALSAATEVLEDTLEAPLPRINIQVRSLS